MLNITCTGSATSKEITSDISMTGSKSVVMRELSYVAERVLDNYCEDKEDYNHTADKLIALIELSKRQ